MSQTWRQRANNMFTVRPLEILTLVIFLLPVNMPKTAMPRLEASPISHASPSRSGSPRRRRLHLHALGRCCPKIALEARCLANSQDVEEDIPWPVPSSSVPPDLGRQAEGCLSQTPRSKDRWLPDQLGIRSRHPDAYPEDRLNTLKASYPGGVTRTSKLRTPTS